MRITGVQRMRHIIAALEYRDRWWSSEKVAVTCGLTQDTARHYLRRMHRLGMVERRRELLPEFEDRMAATRGRRTGQHRMVLYRAASWTRETSWIHGA